MTVEERLDKLESEIKSMKRSEKVNAWGLGALIIALFIAGLFFYRGDITAAEVRSHRFVLVDGNGIPRAELGVIPQGPILGFVDSSGFLRLALSLERAWAGLKVIDEKGQVIKKFP